MKLRDVLSLSILLTAACGDQINPTQVSFFSKADLRNPCLLATSSGAVEVQVTIADDAVTSTAGSGQVLYRVPIRAHVDFSAHGDRPATECLDLDTRINPEWKRQAFVLADGGDLSPITFGGAPVFTAQTVTACNPLDE